jgi:hypothetical protein
MNENEFAKIVWCKGYQIVVMISYDDEEDSYQLCQTTKIDGVEATIKVGFSNEDTCIQAYNEYSTKQSTGFIDSVIEMVN